MVYSVDEPVVLDARQLARIEAVHRGFLYQHLYAANCLLRTGGETVRIVVERDEDIEIVRRDERVYIQVKTRSSSLAPADVADVLERFTTLHREHESGARKGRAQCVIASNSPPSRRLVAMMSAAVWPAYVELHWPDGPEPGRGLPRPAADIGGALRACIERADLLLFGALRPDTLALKLAGMVTLAASGAPPREDHAFWREELSSLFEQLVVQMQDLPAPPVRYRAQVGEPPLLSEGRVRIISGLSGAGKTAWVAEAAVHAPTPVTYMDVADIPGTAVASAVAREVGARMFGRSRGVLGEILLPGATPLETLGALSARLGKDGLDAHVILDNAHAVPSADLRALVDRAPNLRFLLICQPGLTVVELEAALGIRSEGLGGWDEDTISAALADEGCRADYRTCERLSRLTGALPFYVLNAATVAAREYGGSIAELCADFEAQTHTVAVAQEIILRRAFDSLSDEQSNAVGVLSLVDIALTREEATALLQKALGIETRDAATRLRALPRSGMLEMFGNAGLKIHDAVRVFGRAYVAERGSAFEGAALSALRDVILDSIQTDWSIGKLSLLIRLFGQLGEAMTLVQFATDELFHEMGVWPEIEPIMVATAANDEEKPETRFWALDGLVLNDLHEGELEVAMSRLDAMKALLDVGGLGMEEWLAWGMKQMLALTEMGDVQHVLSIGEAVEANLPDSAVHRRIFRYNRTLALYKLGQYERAVEEVRPLIGEYYEVIGLTSEDVMFRNPSELRRLLPEGRDLTDDLKHLADTLDLYAQALGRAGGASPFSRIHAMKFYDLARAPQSLVRVGQDLVDEFIERNDFIGARDVIERNLLPTIQGMGLLAWVVPVRAQYAVVLAYCGDHDSAAAEMARLLPYEAGLNDAQRDELRRQRDLVGRLRRLGGPPQVDIVIPPAIQAALDRRETAGQIKRRRKIGRNEPCPCGSGRKYKRCHGR